MAMMRPAPSSLRRSTPEREDGAAPTRQRWTGFHIGGQGGDQPGPQDVGKGQKAGDKLTAGARRWRQGAVRPAGYGQFGLAAVDELTGRRRLYPARQIGQVPYGGRRTETMTTGGLGRADVAKGLFGRCRRVLVANRVGLAERVMTR